MIKALRTVGRYIQLMGRTFARPERMRMFFHQYLNEMGQLGVNSIDSGIRDTRNHAAGIFLLHHVPNIGRKSGVEHCIRTGYHESDPTD